MRLSLALMLAIVVGLLLAPAPARARAEVHRVFVLDAARLPPGQALPLILVGGDPGADGAAYDVALFAVDSSGQFADAAVAPIVLHAVPAPVPEPGAVLMLACGLLLIVPGGWLTRWSRLGDRTPLLQRRLP